MPPLNDAKGIAIACGLIAAWAVLFYHGCWQIKLTNAPDGSSRRSSWLDIVATFLLLEFVNAGLFITTHDAMHGTICFRWVDAGRPVVPSSQGCCTWLSCVLLRTFCLHHPGLACDDPPCVHVRSLVTVSCWLPP